MEEMSLFARLECAFYHRWPSVRFRNYKLASKAKILVGFTSMLLGSLNAWGSNDITAAVERKYVVTEMSADHDQVTKDGTTMSLKCAGIYSLPTTGIITTPPDNTVLDGRIKSPNVMVKYTLESLGAHVLQTGDKVYITRIEDRSDTKGDVLKFSILTTDNLDVKGQDTQKKYSATVSFHFKKHYFDDAPPGDVEHVIEEVMAPAAVRRAPPASSPRPRAVAAATPAAPAAPAGPPPTISIGETSSQVLQAMGMPQQMIDLGSKKTYIYKNMKVVFVDDKVSDVQ
jgi:hypothetical protein